MEAYVLTWDDETLQQFINQACKIIKYLSVQISVCDMNPKKSK